MNYYVARNGQTYGPYNEETIRKYLAEGSMLPRIWPARNPCRTGSLWASYSSRPQLPPARRRLPPIPLHHRWQVETLRPTYTGRCSWS